ERASLRKGLALWAPGESLVRLKHDAFAGPVGVGQAFAASWFPLHAAEEDRQAPVVVLAPFLVGVMMALAQLICVPRNTWAVTSTKDSGLKRWVYQPTGGFARSPTISPVAVTTSRTSWL